MNPTSAPFRVVLLLGVLLLAAAGCTYPKIKYLDPASARARVKEPTLLFPPLYNNANAAKDMAYLGKAYYTALSGRINGDVIYAANVESLSRAIAYDSLIINGGVNTKEVATIARNLGCNSALTVRVINFKGYPPFRMVVELTWVDSVNGNVLARAFEDLDLTNTETEYRFNNFVGDGPARSAYESISYYRALGPTAALKPSEFMNFVADYSTKILFDHVNDDTFGWRLWYSL